MLSSIRNNMLYAFVRAHPIACCSCSTLIPTNPSNPTGAATYSNRDRIFSPCTLASCYCKESRKDLARIQILAWEEGMGGTREIVVVHMRFAGLAQWGSPVSLRYCVHVRNWKFRMRYLV